MTTHSRCPVTGPADVDLLEAAQLRCPWPSYDALREQAPVWKDPRSGQYVVTRHADVQRVLLDPDTFRASMPDADDTHRPEIKALYEEKGMLPGTTINAMDDPEHRQVRGLMDFAFRPKRVQLLDPYIEDLCRRLLATFIDGDEVELAGAYAHEMALGVMTHIMAVPEEDAHKIKAWSDAWVLRLSQTMTPEQEIWSCEQEIEAQHYFQPIIDRLRAAPEENLMSDLVNGVVPEWGHGLADNQIHIEVLVDLFTGGSQTTGHALLNAVKRLAEDQELWDRVCADQERLLPILVEECVRTDGPQQGNPRITSREVEIAGTVIPEGATVNVRWGAGNRDPREFGESPGEIDLERRAPRRHLGFGAGVHYCIGAAIARRELYFGLKVLMENCSRIWLLEDPDEIPYLESYVLRGPSRLRLGFERRAPSAA